MIFKEIKTKYGNYGRYGEIIPRATSFSIAGKDTAILTSDLTALNASPKLSLYWKGKITEVGVSNIASLFWRGGTTSNWLHLFFNTSTLIVNTAGPPRFYAFAKQLTLNEEMEFLFTFDGSLPVNKGRLNMNNTEFITASSQEDPEPTTLGSFTGVSKFSWTEDAISDQIVSAFAIWNDVVTFEEARAGLKNPLCYFDGNGTVDYLYNLANNNHATRSGTGDRYTYDKLGSTRPLTNGYSLWQHDTLDDIQVPYGLDGNPLSLTAGVNIPAGYVKTRDAVGEFPNHNMADSYIDHDPLGTAATVLDILNRDNLTIHSAAAQTGYYDSSHPYWWHVTEEADPRIYSSFFNVGYRGKFYGKIMSELIAARLQPVRLDETIVYNTDRTLDKEWSTFGYCKLKDYALIIDGTYVPDENNYVTLIP